jgi:signal transduction histidine kinase/ActR/RegA family two-component response regulator
MKMVDIRTRMLVVAILPVTVLAVLLAAVFLVARFGDIDDAHKLRARSLARQLATASEYGLFAADISYLQTIASGALRESDVRSVAIVNGLGQILVRAGKPGYTTPPVLTSRESERPEPATHTDLLVQPITATQVKLDDLFEAKTGNALASPPLLGHVLVELSRESLLQRERDVLLVGLAVTFGGLLFGGFLAVRLGRGVVHPILRVSRLIERIGRGELSARAQVLPGDPLHDLQLGVNQMAERLESGRDELEQRIALATLELRAKKEEAETATLAKSRFLAAASHDLRQPAHALGLFVARLAQLPHDAETRHLIGNLEASVRATQDLLDSLLDVSRLDAQAVPVQLRPFALADIFDQMRGGLTLGAQEKGLRLRVRPTRVWLMSDPALLHRILLNLVVNALRYTRQGSVLLACRRAGDGRHARIEVWDSGIGIAPEHHQAIFKEFYQVGNSERDRGKGLGLGLNIVERTAGLLGHRLNLCSSLGRGTRFRIEVPLAPPGAAFDTSGVLEVKMLHDLANRIVLVIEDDALAREGLVSLLESWGCAVGAADGLSTALQQLGNGLVPEVIVSDYRLRGGSNGIEVIHQLRLAAGHSIPACLISGDTDPALMQAARDAGLVLLHKPVRPAKLRTLIRRFAADSQTSGTDLV